MRISQLHEARVWSRREVVAAAAALAACSPSGGDRPIASSAAPRATGASALSAASEPLPTLFVSHGAPNLLLSDLPVRGFLEQLGARVPKPRAILCISAHWLTRAPTVDVSPRPKTIHDFQGFEPQMYAVRYDAPGAVELAERIADELAGTGVDVRTEPRGLDHGAWVPLKLAYAAGDVPVTQLSLQPGRSAEHHYELGRKLAKLRHEGVLVIGSGGATHNLGEIGPGDQLPEWAAKFDAWLDERARAGDAEALVDYRRRAPDAARNHPTEDHYVPILVALGAAGDAARGTTIHESAAYGSLSLRAFSFA